jgi:hypothetical protein
MNHCITIKANTCPYELNPAFVALLNQELGKIKLKRKSSVVLNFRDPDYSVESGGFHPVEIMISSTGEIGYITDFAYVGIGPYAELVKEIDFDFSLNAFGHMGRDYPLSRGKQLFNLWQENFVSYYRMGVFKVRAEAI